MHLDGREKRVFGTLRGEHLFDAISGHSAVILPKMWRQNAANWTVTPRNPREPEKPAHLRSQAPGRATYWVVPV